MGKKPEIFKPNMSFIDNNKKAYYSYLEEPSLRKEEEKEELGGVQDFLNKISNSGGYVFNKKVVIVTKDKTYDTKIAGKIGNRLVTIDNDSISINDILKIYEKK